MSRVRPATADRPHGPLLEWEGQKARGYDLSGAHWTGWVEISPDHADFALWQWIIAREDRLDEIISGEDLEAIRERFADSSRPDHRTRLL